ncbi:MAG: SUMF1/EgtB/PvdO family nonheme iron enzyme [Planctomycetota bacterium]
MDQSAVETLFAELFLADLTNDTPRSLREYQALFPGHEEAIAGHYRRLRIDGHDLHLGSGEAKRANARMIGRYRILEELGRGGQGEVYLAEDTHLTRRVAVKVLSAKGTFAREARRRFRREAEVASRLHHPAICGVYEVGEDDGTHFIAMHYVEGRSLAKALDRVKRDPRARLLADASAPPGPNGNTGASRNRADMMRVLRFIEQCACALHSAHEARLVHRDIKPSNIMVTAGGEPVLLDFGLARDVASESLTLTGDVMGTPAYMSPEQLRGDQAVDRRTDVYSLGATLFECLTLRRPYEYATYAGLLHAILAERTPDPRRWNPAIPRNLKVVLEKAIAKNPGHRYQTALELAEELRRVREHEPIRARPVGPLQRLGLWARRNPAVAGLAAGAFLLLALGLAITLRTNRKLDTALGEVERLSDAKHLESFESQAAELWPAHPERIPDFEDWLERTKPLLARIPEHEVALARLRLLALPYTGEERARDFATEFGRLESLERDVATRRRRLGGASLDAATRELLSTELERKKLEIRGLRKLVAGRRSYRFDDFETGWRHDVLADLVVELGRFADPSAGTRAAVKRRLRTARSLQKRLGQDSALWRACIAEIRASPLYRGHEIAPQTGLVPLGADPETGLQEFLHLLTHAPAAPVPERGPGGRIQVSASCGVILVLLPGGRFWMGAQSEDPGGRNYDPRPHRFETPAHEVELDAFLISKYEMTQAQWQRFRHRNPSFYRPGGPMNMGAKVGFTHPVERVSWTDSRRVLAQLGLCLPTEAQWEYAARAGTSTRWWTGDDEDSLIGAANLRDASTRRESDPVQDPDMMSHDDGYWFHAPVGSFRPNAFGLYDVLGNLWEWCEDEAGSYETGVRKGDGKRLVGDKKHRIARGGSYVAHPWIARVTCRSPHAESFRHFTIGVRPARRLD